MATNGGYNMHKSCGHSCNVIKKWQWDITKMTGHNGNIDKYAVLVLNRPISQRTNFIKNFWNNAVVKVTVDGGTTRWDTFVSKLPEDDKENILLPDLITGDFDSITEEILQKYKKKGCKIIHTPDQNHTDFTKALMELNNYCSGHKLNIDHAVAIAQASGRIDQILGNVQTLYLAKQKHLLNFTTNVYVLSDDAMSWLLFPGDHIIFVPEETRKHEKSWCSLIPMGEICESVTTTGLKWNLDNASLKFGEVVSTSNTFDGSEKVTIKCSNTILWSMKVPSICS